MKCVLIGCNAQAKIQNKSLQTVKLVACVDMFFVIIKKPDRLSIVAKQILITFLFFSSIVLKLLKTAEGIRKLLDTVAEALPQVSGLKSRF